MFILFRSCSGYFHFKLIYPELPGFNEWTQTSNPVQETKVIGYQGDCNCKISLLNQNIIKSKLMFLL